MIHKRYLESIFEHMENIRHTLGEHRLAKCTESFGIEIKEVPEKHKCKLENFLNQIAKDIEKENIHMDNTIYSISMKIEKTDTGYTLYPKIPDNLHFNERLRLTNTAWHIISSKIKRFGETLNYR